MAVKSAYKLLNQGSVPAIKMLGKTVVRAEDVERIERHLPAYPIKKGRSKKAYADVAPWDIELPGDLRAEDGMRVQPLPLKVE